MIMAGYEYEGKMPFKNVYFTGIVRDKLGRKMSKSLGNSPDPLELIEKYGADGVRMGMMLSAPAEMCIRDSSHTQRLVRRRYRSKGIRNHTLCNAIQALSLIHI